MCNDASISRDKDQRLKEYGFENNSMAIMLGLYDNDALHIRTYYLKLFLRLEIFGKHEQQFLDYCLKRDEIELKSLKPIKRMSSKDAKLFSPKGTADYN